MFQLNLDYHIASSKCRTLKSRTSQVWCKRMLEEGVAATLGSTSEPYVQTFLVPEIFFGLLLDGPGRSNLEKIAPEGVYFLGNRTDIPYRVNIQLDSITN